MPRDPDWLKKAKSEGLINKVQGIRLPMLGVEKELVPLFVGIQGEIEAATQLINFELIMKEPDIVPESYFQDAVATVARYNGWLVAHFRPAKERGQYATPVAYDAEGFPDLVLVRERVVYAECKSEKGELTFEESKWIDRLQKAWEEVYVWRPSMCNDIKRILEEKT